MSAVPPPRYRVVEDGRRLVVIDCWASEGRPARTTSAAPVDTVPARPNPFAAARQTRFDGSARLTTHPLYDANGPREITLDPGAATIVKAARIGTGVAALGLVLLVILSPLVLIPLLILAGNIHKQVRTRVTAWLDTVARENG